jgi:hypothetical protein
MSVAYHASSTLDETDESLDLDGFGQVRVKPRLERPPAV